MSGIDGVHADLAAVARAVTLVDASTVLVDGERTQIDGPDPESALAGLIYRRCYVRPYGHRRNPVVDTNGDRVLQASLSAAAPNGRTWERGWQWDSTDGDLTVVVRDNVRLWARPDGVRAPHDAGLTVGGPCELLVPTERQWLIPGFHAVVGHEPWTAADEEAGVLRLYWHATDASATPLLAAMRTALDDAGVPFRLKTPRSGTGYRRADAAVLYLPRSRFPNVRTALAAVHAELADGLRPTVPLFTKRLGRGLGLAEDPGSTESFGQHRCRIVARALIDAGPTGPDAGLAAVIDAFRSAGLDPDRPHLSPGSTGSYEWPAATAAPVRAGSDDSAFLSAALRIGQAICEQALWNSDGTRCTWIARSSLGAQDPVFVPRLTTLGADLYAGTSGVAVFLAELFIRTGEADLARTARGAMAYAVDAAPVDDPGLYSGLLGVALAARRVGRLLGTPDNAADLARAALTGPPPTCDDLISGRAGMILALLALAPVLGEDVWRRPALRLGTELVAAVAGYPTDGPPTAGLSPLTGLSHGAAGVAVALLDLAAETGRADFADAALAAFAYERGLFDPVAGNWPDLRRDPTATSDGPRFVVAWCHGAPGIALSRLRAGHPLDPQAFAALATTRDDLELRQTVDAWDATPCHGIAGLIEALWIGGHTLDRPDYRAAAREAARWLAERPVTALRSGTPCGGPNPSLLLGTAGVGYQLLRMIDPHGVPSMLSGFSRHLPQRFGAAGRRAG